MIKKIFILGITGVLSGNINAQVGINTEKPTSSLDINGSVRTTANLLVGGDDNTPGSAGSPGQFLISKGAGASPEWQTVEVSTPDTGDWFLLGSISRSDTKGGLLFTREERSGAISYPTNFKVYKASSTTDNTWSTSETTISNKWKEFEDFTLDLPKYDAALRIVINIQVLVQAYWPTNTIPRDNWMSFALAVFKDVTTKSKKSKTAEIMASRQAGVRGTRETDSNTPQQLFTFVVAVDLPANTDTKLYILGTQRNNNVFDEGSFITIGHLLNNSSIDDSILRRATMRADIYKKVK